MIMSMGWGYVYKPRHQRAYCSSHRWYMSMENHGGIVLTGKTVSPTRTLWKSFQQSHLVANQEKLAEANDEFSLRRFFSCFDVIFYMSLNFTTWGLRHYSPLIAPMMEAVRTSETSVNFNVTTRPTSQKTLNFNKWAVNFNVFVAIKNFRVMKTCYYSIYS
jgi:hypothetical protein